MLFPKPVFSLCANNRCVVCVCRKSIQAQLRGGGENRKETSNGHCCIDITIDKSKQSITFGSLGFQKDIKRHPTGSWWSHLTENNIDKTETININEMVTPVHTMHTKSHTTAFRPSSNLKTISISKHLFLEMKFMTSQRPGHFTTPLFFFCFLFFVSLVVVTVFCPHPQSEG